MRHAEYVARGRHDLDALLIARDALDRTSGERDAFVSARCGHDETLRRRVDAMLSDIAGCETAEAESTDTPADLLIGTRLGAYRIVERIGRGGMGVVYRGAREGDDVAHDVAIKLIRRGFDFDDIRARFLRERRILARLSHPNLARFIDGGVAPDGRPWFALEFVRGAPITRWCDEHGLSVRARVRLMLGVCAAVQHAHAQLVVHRDLKPDNVLIDERGEPRLLDFGVAGLLAGDEESGADPTTIAARRAITPEYAAPEQLGAEGGGVQSDVYALGAILYELVGATLAYPVDRRADLAEARRLRAAPPAPIADAIARDGTRALTSRLAARSTTLRAYRADVRGDFTRIIETALATEPARRYATVQAFADDLARWLDGAPVLVSGDGAGYRFGKFVGRHRSMVALTAAAIAILSAFAVFHIASLRGELARTETQRSRAQASFDLLRRLLASPDPEAEFGPNTTLGEFLEKASTTLGEDRTLDPVARGEIDLTLAASLRSVDKYDEALAIANHVASTATSTPGGWRNRVAALVEIGQIKTLQGDYRPALATLQSADRVAREHHVTEPLVLATLYSTEAVAHNHLGEWSASIKLCDAAIAAATPIREREPAFYANLLGLASIPRGYPLTDLAGAENLLRQSLSFLAGHGLGDSGLYANTQGELAQTLVDEGRFEEAEPMLRGSVEAMRKRYGTASRETSFKLSDLALLYFRWNRLGEARRWRDEATSAMTAALGAKHPFVALDLIESADLAFQEGDAVRAARDAADGAAIAGENDHDEFAARASLYAAWARCAGGDANAAARLDARVAAIGNAFGTRPFDVRLAAARCDLALGRKKAALAAIEPFTKQMEQGAKIPRTDYIVPAIESIRSAAGR